MCSHKCGGDLITAWTYCSSVRICPTAFRSRIMLDIPLRCSVIETLRSLRFISNLRTKLLSLMIEVPLKVNFNCSHITIAVGKFSTPLPHSPPPPPPPPPSPPYEIIVHAIQYNIASTTILLGPSFKSLKVTTVLGLSSHTLNRCHHCSGQTSGKVILS